ncbi:MAG: hypothetical protein A2268_11205 [Candidatus Raymondbacteria bacterium RifOxyA12_full_50_37]|uniref:Glycosyltransferase 2-like domain-containing protein n=1 Tax=Candidatus Raymondbacteria bacterium RIFOXYD12_FULL_49_13 TaxID=1817890 RepID=A0A1F7F7D8_UNCRA|nr:MAG: hypothetical protein A2268_11205 [Candidatus Raymondbacteria bacterium RifOxyA12_full_50_37]OGJ85574.1 MAG: hypothetical protein A2248_12990 [Candidatus Raymondbacteria bacterium RIFOXYA2_FULL_49_16]OGJ92826.1 MAG: hypothetical protein A2350_16940 [Candidatus Raymondbacteria bacterium RifOxyB12_full_50_8]OGJ93165.1 MAG: hypothetical protein A2487_08955 [Candidatus Raymondbacteria bacterium RifOxyC12_full_50_8]OGJ95077.1 MAG: hypothetical protein A2453_07690 [Candidatus Raymondbacteria b
MKNTLPVYAVITPVRDEERYITWTLKSMVRQTHLPTLWIIVDDSSTDNTPNLVRKYAAHHAWIQYRQIQRASPRQTGSAEILAFNYGLDFLDGVPYDILVKLDADVSISKDYFAELVSRFARNEKLGIASGVYLERKKQRWTPVPMPAYHAAGASKAVRAACFKEMGGFVPHRGWDTADEITALSLGWETRHFPELKFYHLKNEGSGMGLLFTGIMHGEIMYRTTGGVFLFMLLKSLARIVADKPFFLGGVALLFGYLKTMIARPSLLVSPKAALLYRGILNQRLFEGFHRITLHAFKRA